MPSRRIPFRTHEVYHVYNRGVARQRIFFSAGHYRFFLQRISEYVLPVANIVAYCLMPNHYHLVMQLKDESLSESMRSLGCSYTQAINKCLGRRGPLFESRFKAIHVDSDRYLDHLSRYIHLNPLVGGLVKTPERWAFSSLHDYLRPEPEMLSQPALVMSKFTSPADYVAFMNASMLAEPLGLHSIKLDAFDDTDYSRVHE
jgi:REP element-mobilizing transposase RayT